MSAKQTEFSPNQVYEVGMFEINMNALKKLDQQVAKATDAKGASDTDEPDEDQRAPWSHWSAERQRHIIRIQARGNYQQNNHRVELQYVVISETDTIKEGRKNTAKGEDIKSIHHLSEKTDLTDAEARKIAEEYRTALSSPRQVEKLLSHLEIPEQVLQAFQMQRYPYTHVATVLVEWDDRILLQNSRAPDGSKQMVLPTMEEEKGFIGLERSLSSLFSRKGLRIENVTLSAPAFDNDERRVVYCATATPEGESLATAFDKATFTAIDKTAIQRNPEVTEDTKQLLRWIDQNSKQTNG